MIFKSFRTLAALGLMAVASLIPLSAQTTLFTVNPTSLSFTTSDPKTVAIGTNNSSLPFTTVTCPAGLTCVYNDTLVNVSTPRQAPFTIRVTPNANVGSTQQSIEIRAVGVQPTNVPVTYGTGVGGTTLVASPNPLTFSYPAGTIGNQVSTVSVSGPAVIPFSISATGGLAPYLSFPSLANTGDAIAVTLVNPSIIPSGTTGTLTFTPGTGYTGTSITVQATQSGTSGTPLAVTPSAFNFSYTAGTTTAIDIPFTVGGVPNGIGFTTTVTGLNGLVNVVQGGTSNSAYNFSLLNPSAVTTYTTGSVLFTPSTPGYTSVTVPVTISPNGAVGSGSIVVNPSVITFSYGVGAGTQIVNVNTSGPPVGTPFSVSASGNAAFYITAPGSGTVGNVFQISIANPTNVPSGTTGFLTFTPAAPYTATTVPVTINSSTIGTGSLAVNPTTLTFNAALGTGTATPVQYVTVSSNDLNTPSQFFNVSTTSTNNFLVVTANTQTTPAQLSVGVNLANITTPGTYTGTIALTGFSTLTGTQQIQVTLNVTGAVTVTPDQTSLTISVPSGSTASQTRIINLTSPSTGLQFTASSNLSFVTVTSSSTTVPGALTVTVNPSGLAVGSYTGNITVTAGSTNVATIPITVTVSPSGTLQVSPTQVSFAYQTSSTTAPTAQAISVTSNGVALPFTAAATTTNGGTWLQVSSSTGTTPGTVTISVLPTGLAASATPYTGTITITSAGATNSPVTIPVMLTVSTPAVPQITSFVNAASFGPTAAAPGLIFTIFGRDLGPTTLTPLQVTNGFVGTNVANTRVLFDGIPAPVIYASATQLSAIVPYEVAGRFTTRLQVEYNGQLSSPVELRVADSAPAIFTLNAQGTGQGAILNQDLAPNVPGNPEARNRSIVIYATGEGQTSAQGSTGRITLPVASDLRRPLLPVVVRIGGRPAVVEYAGSAPGLVSGLIQINARIPADAPTGSNVPIEVQIGSNTSQLGVTVAVQ